MVMQNMQGAGGSGWLGQMSSDESNARGRFILDSDRYKILERKESFFECTQHDTKRYDFDGRIINTQGSTVLANQPLMSGEKASIYIPLRARRPSMPYRLARVITTSFTSMLFGDQRFPTFQITSDPKSQDYCQTLARLASLPVRMIQARNIGGSTGTACLSWAFVDGKPRVRVHNPKYIHVHEWADRDEFIPRHVIECFQYDDQIWSPTKKKLVTVKFWHRRDWLDDCDVVYLPVPVQAGVEPQWVPDWSRTIEHRDGTAHFVWIQNLPADTPDGDCDYEGLFDNFDTLDLILSIIGRGAILNLDPTLVLKLDPDAINSGGVRKGSENALVTGTDGDAKYLELVGTSITAGINLFNRERETTLEVAQCVLLDPDKAAAQGSSSVAQKMLYSPMLAKCDVLREQYGPGMQRILEQMMRVARGAAKTPVYFLGPDEKQHCEYRIPVVPPKAITTPGQNGQPDQVKLEPREPGTGTEVDPQWGQYFPATPQDKTATGAMLFQATGQKAYLSTQTANEEAAKILGRDPATEWQRVQEEQDEAEGKANQMFAGATNGGPGSKVSHTAPVPGGGTITRQAAPPPPPSMPEAPPSDSTSSSSDDGALPMTPTSAAAIITVNEARASLGLDPMPEPDGHLSLAAYQAKFAVPIAIAANAGLGKTGTSPAGAPVPGPGGGMAGHPPPKPTAPPPGAAPGAPPGLAPHPTPPGAPPAPPGGAQAPHPAIPPAGPPKPPGGGFPPK